MNTASNDFGCNTCWPKVADEAWEAVKHLKSEIELIDESHFMIKVRSCKKCSQQFLWVFTETIDWKDGEDPQYWAVLPITPAEAYQLLSDGGTTVTALLGLSSERKSLCHDFPKGSEPKSYWSQGIVIGPHD
ncbi:hypothetical protein [Thiorhodovibrio frisius]|uniref:hypothetical protein n=1 Tax=Thiorhodovibrio frisius TaxID=631362 RepID=UPI00117E9F32|nr:hypothetical protein [Thiorhodovibrio frisius]